MESSFSKYTLDCFTNEAADYTTLFGQATGISDGSATLLNPITGTAQFTTYNSVPSISYNHFFTRSTKWAHTVEVGHTQMNLQLDDTVLQFDVIFQDITLIMSQLTQ